MLLIGVNAPEVFWVQDERRGKIGEPYAVKTILGLSLLGPTARKISVVGKFEAHFFSLEKRQEKQEWKCVYTKSDSADDATKDLSSAKLTAKSHWSYAPQFLLEDERCWPAAPYEFICLPDEFAVFHKPVACMNVDLKQSTIDLFFADTSPGHVSNKQSLGSRGKNPNFQASLFLQDHSL